MRSIKETVGSEISEGFIEWIKNASSEVLLEMEEVQEFTRQIDMSRNRISILEKARNHKVYLLLMDYRSVGVRQIRNNPKKCCELPAYVPTKFCDSELNNTACKNCGYQFYSN